MTTTEPVTVVVPVFRSADSLKLLSERLNEVLKTHDEVVLVDDGSNDDTWNVVKSLTTDSRYRGIRLGRNSGQHAALLAGVRSARNQVIVTLDDDLQHQPESICSLLDVLNSKTDVVYGVSEKLNQPGIRSLTSRLGKRLMEFALRQSGLTNISSFRAFRTNLRDGFAGHLGPDISLDALLNWTTTRIKSVNVKHHPRTHGQSNYTFRMLLKYFFDVATGYSTLPLRLATVLGLASITLSIGVLFFVLWRPLVTGESVPGFPFLAATIAIFAGTQLVVLGILGQYIGRMHFRVMSKPTYIIAERTDDALT